MLSNEPQGLAARLGFSSGRSAYDSGVPHFQEGKAGDNRCRRRKSRGVVGHVRVVAGVAGIKKLGPREQCCERDICPALVRRADIRLAGHGRSSRRVQKAFCPPLLPQEPR
jgi:hypothetical protein